jgi:hypothetical protein
MDLFPNGRLEYDHERASRRPDMWNWIAFLGPPIVVIVGAWFLRRRQSDIDSVQDREFRDPPVGDYLGRLGGGKMG